MSSPVSIAAQGQKWNHAFDVVVVGSGASGLVAALNAAKNGARVLILEKAPTVGGTSFRSGGACWVPNNHYLRAQGIEDSREDALRYMARAARPHLYSEDSPKYGLAAWEYDLHAAFYDHAGDVFEALSRMDAYRSLHVPDLPDYYAQLDENRVKQGRVLIPLRADGRPGSGSDMVERLEASVRACGVEIVLEHQVVDAVVSGDGDVVGLRAVGPDGPVLVQARRGVIFASGGFTHNQELRDNYLAQPVFGGCAVATNEGDFVPIAQRLGAAMRNMNYAWLAPLLVERAIRRDPNPASVFWPGGDSILYVNKYGRRGLNEKAPYNELVLQMGAWDGKLQEYPNLLMFPIWDQSSMERFRGTLGDAGLMPAEGTGADHLMKADTLEELTDLIRARVEGLATSTGGVRLADDFGKQLELSIERFNELARTGCDTDFRRGETPVERHGIELVRAQARQLNDDLTAEWVPGSGPVQGADDGTASPNPTMREIAAKGPYYASILGSGTLDTKGGPMTNRHGQVLDHAGKPIGGLYAVGNCAASPQAHAYFAGGSTLAPMITFAWFAGAHAAGKPISGDVPVH